MPQQGHALVIGGSGMLRGVCLSLAREGWRVTCVGRDEAKLQGLQAEAAAAGGRLRGLSVDYRENYALHQALQQTLAEGGPVELVIAWIHSDDLLPLQTLVEELSVPGLPWRLFVVRGSRAAAPDARPMRPEVGHTRCQYREIILGWMGEPAETRWLTHAEIAGGVLNAIDRDYAETVVGVVRPWGARPD